MTGVTWRMADVKIYMYQVKVNFKMLPAMKELMGTSDLDRGEWSASISGHLTRWTVPQKQFA